MEVSMKRGLRNDQGVALPLALLVLLTLSALLLAFVSMAGMEPQISRNLNDTTKARYLADTGVEYAYDQLVALGSLNAALQTNCPQSCGQLANGLSLPGLPATSGTFSVTVRNDNQPGDNQITGVAPEPAANVTTDTNNIVIVVATGTYNNMTRTVQTAMTGPWDLPAGVFANAPNFEFELKALVKGAFSVTGNDTNLNGTAGPGRATLGIGATTAAQVTSINTSLTPNPPTQPLDLRPQVQGLGGNPTGTPPVASVGLVTPIPPNLTTAALTTLVNQLTPMAAQTITGGTTFLGNLMGPGGTPQVTVVDVSNGLDAIIGGTGIGKGILIVKGGAAKAGLKISGSFQFQGLVIACCSPAGAGGLEVELEDTAKVFGGVVMANATSAETELELEGPAAILRSTQGMALARQLIPNGRGTVWSWREL